MKVSGEGLEVYLVSTTRFPKLTGNPFPCFIMLNCKLPFVEQLPIRTLDTV